MEMPVKSKVEEINLRPHEFLLPIFEVVVNSIISTVEGKSPGLIQIEIERDTEGLFESGAFVDKSGAIMPSPIRSISIKDNGSGFNDDNFKSFNTAYSETHKARGCKGVGRFTMLACFNKVSVTSIYKKSSEQWKREFTFDIKDEVHPTNGSPVKVEEKTSRETLVKLLDYKSPFKQKTAISTWQIAEAIIDHCLPFFLNDTAPTMTIREDSEDQLLVLNDILKSVITFDGKPGKFIVDKNHAVFNVIIVKKSDGRINRLKFCAHNRVVGKTRNLSSLMPEFEGPIRKQDEAYYVDVYVTSTYFDENVNTLRNSFSIYDEEDDGGLLNEVTIKDIENGLVKELNSKYRETIEKMEAETLQRVKMYILDPKKLRVRYRSLLGRPDLLKKIPYNATGDHLEEHLIKIKIRLERELGQDLKKALKRTQPEDFEEYSEIIKKYIDQEAKFAKDKLADLVIHRKGVLHLLKKLVKFGKDQKYYKEEDLHNIIFPMGKDIDTLPYEYHNLWLLDERLTFHSYVSSDQKLKNNPHVNLKSAKEADLLIFDFPWAFSERDRELSSMVVFEFKRPGRDMNNEAEKKVDTLVMKYFEDLLENKAKDQNGQLLNLEDTTPKFGFVICEMDKGLVNYNIKFNDFRATPSGSLYKIVSPLNLHIEVMTFQQMISFSEKRHLAFFKELGIEDLK